MQTCMYVLYSQASHTGTRILTKGSLAKKKTKINKQTNKHANKLTNKNNFSKP